MEDNCWVTDIFDPCDMDREEFNPNLWMQQYTKECSLQNLMSRRLHLDKEVEKMSSEFQNMLYENYCKITNGATVLSTVSGGLKSMEDEMDQLRSKMKDVEDFSTAILDSLKPMAENISMLREKRDAMRKLVWLTNLVPTLKEYTNVGQYNEAARYYSKAKAVLDKHRNSASLKGIVEECAEIVAIVRHFLRGKLNLDVYGRSELAEAMNLLLAIGEPPDETLSYYIRRCSVCLESTLKAIDECKNNTLEESVDFNAGVNKSVTLVINISCGYVEMIEKTLKSTCDAFFEQNSSRKADNVMKVLSMFLEHCFEKLSEKLRKFCKKLLANVSDDVLAKVLDKFVRQCCNSSPSVPELNMYKRSINVVLNICEDRCAYYLQNLKTGFDRALVKLGKDASGSVQIINVFTQTKEGTEKELNKILNSLASYISPEIKCCRQIAFRRPFCKQLVRENLFMAYLKHTIQSVLSMVKTIDSKESTAFMRRLILGKYMLDMHDRIALFLQDVDDTLCSTAENVHLTPADDIASDFRECSFEILRYCVEERCLELTEMVGKSIETRNWMNSVQPIRPRAVIRVLLDDFQQTKKDAEKLLKSLFRQSRSRLYESKPFRSLQSIPTILSGEYISEDDFFIDKTFMPKQEFEEKLEFDADSVTCFIVKKTLKAFVEYVRLTTYNHYGFQQLQVDLCFLQVGLSKMEVSDGVLNYLYDAILSSALSRTHKPAFMDRYTVLAVCKNTNRFP